MDRGRSRAMILVLILSLQCLSQAYPLNNAVRASHRRKVSKAVSSTESGTEVISTEETTTPAATTAKSSKEKRSSPERDEKAIADHIRETIHYLKTGIRDSNPDTQSRLKKDVNPRGMKYKRSDELNPQNNPNRLKKDVKQSYNSKVGGQKLWREDQQAGMVQHRDAARARSCVEHAALHPRPFASGRAGPPSPNHPITGVDEEEQDDDDDDEYYDSDEGDEERSDAGNEREAMKQVIV